MGEWVYTISSCVDKWHRCPLKRRGFILNTQIEDSFDAVDRYPTDIIAHFAKLQVHTKTNMSLKSRQNYALNVASIGALTALKGASVTCSLFFR